MKDDSIIENKKKTNKGLLRKKTLKLVEMDDSIRIKLDKLNKHIKTNRKIKWEGKNIFNHLRHKT